jgi:hypothetical protein
VNCINVYNHMVRKLVLVVGSPTMLLLLVFVLSTCGIQKIGILLFDSEFILGYMSYCRQLDKYRSCEFKLCLWRGVLDITLRNKVCQRFSTGRWFSPGTQFASTNKNDWPPLYDQWRIQRGEGTFAPPPLKKERERGGTVFRPSIKHISIHAFAC